MGKTGRWIKNILVGKKEEKYKKNIDASSSDENVSSKSGSQPGSNPKMKLRWSFGRSAGKRAAHKRYKSLDSIDNKKLSMQAMADYEVQQNHAMSESEALHNFMALAVVSRALKNAAATKIQAVFRSFMAKKALHALKALVKLQALFRGHLVRKQTIAIMRSMHALMAIQVRARAQRILKVEEAHLVNGQSSAHRNLPQENGFRRMHRDTVDMNLDAIHEVLKSKSAYLNYSQVERTEHGFPRYYSGQLPMSRQEHQFEKYPFTAQNSPQTYPATPKQNPTRESQTCQQPDCVDHMSYGYPYLPNYMAKTESSRAKVRSQSEPSQRPDLNMRPESKRRESSVEHDAWFSNVYQPTTRTSKDRKCDASSTTSSHSNHYRSLDAYEPYVNMY